MWSLGQGRGTQSDARTIQLEKGLSSLGRKAAKTRQLFFINNPYCCPLSRKDSALPRSSTKTAVPAALYFGLYPSPCGT
jgi:hypothetical protein